MIAMSQIVHIERHEWEEGSVGSPGLAALTFAAPQVSEMSAPKLVFVLHGLGSRKERHLDLCLRLANAGFRACAVDARLHGERQTAESSLLWGERTTMEFAAVFAATVRGTIADLSRIADELGAERYGVVGHSMGGLIATLTGISDPRVAVVVNVGGSIDTRLPLAVTALLTPEILAEAAALDPIARAGELWPAAVLLLHGAEDQTVPVSGARDLHRALVPHYASASERLSLVELVGVGHEFTAEQARMSVEFVRKFL
jgi:pimeloyl-ACP methyl ester carboxylesterase